jgi:protease-4
LVDELGGTLDAIAKAAELAELDEWAVKRYERTDDFRTRLLRNFGASATTNYSNETQTAKFATELTRFFQVINQFNDPAGTYARLPLDFVIE